jgi:hypothetical protein
MAIVCHNIGHNSVYLVRVRVYEYECEYECKYEYEYECEYECNACEENKQKVRTA